MLRTKITILTLIVDDEESYKYCDSLWHKTVNPDSSCQLKLHMNVSRVKPWWISRNQSFVANGYICIFWPVDLSSTISPSTPILIFKFHFSLVFTVKYFLYSPYLISILCGFPRKSSNVAFPWGGTMMAIFPSHWMISSMLVLFSIFTWGVIKIAWNTKRVFYQDG